MEGKMAQKSTPLSRSQGSETGHAAQRQASEGGARTSCVETVEEREEHDWPGEGARAGAAREGGR